MSVVNFFVFFPLLTVSLPKHLSLQRLPAGSTSLSLLSLRVLFSLNLSLLELGPYAHLPAPNRASALNGESGHEGWLGARMLELGGRSELGRRSYTSSGVATWLL